MNKYEEITNALLKAKEVAQEFINTEDGGTCNFDSPTIDYREMHLQKSKVIEAIEAAGLRCFEWNLYKNIKLVVCGIGSGQGNRKTRMAEAAYNSLKKDGISTGMYYQMD